MALPHHGDAAHHSAIRLMPLTQRDSSHSPELPRDFPMVEPHGLADGLDDPGEGWLRSRMSPRMQRILDAIDGPSRLLVLLAIVLAYVWMLLN